MRDLPPPTDDAVRRTSRPRAAAAESAVGARSGLGERLEVRLRSESSDYDLRSRSAPGALVATFRPGTDRVVLDALRRPAPEGGDEVWVSLFDVALQRGQVVSLAVGGARDAAPRARFDGPPGSVLWWLRERGGRVEVRDVRSGGTFRVGPTGLEFLDRDAPGSSAPPS